MLPQKISENRFIYDIKINHKFTSFVLAELDGRKYNVSMLNDAYCFLEKDKTVQLFGENNILEDINLENLDLFDLGDEYYNDDKERYAIELKIKLNENDEFDIVRFDSILNNFMSKLEAEISKRFDIIRLDYNKNKIEVLEVEKWKPVSINNVIFARTVLYFM